ncbi:bacterio-opsin activator domain-containing protein [Natrinema salinisoli]|uniref:helix-turn-helix domain-containing protein n=1 Tax=Natrinema salinisoli TaxID=2878535 RepID=UPI001CF061CE|nr:bacterio-opsin activator domain-containing protein [Natrinema salinisoli]
MSLQEPSARPVCEVEFGFQDPRYPFVGVTKKESCRFELAEMLPRPDGRYAEYFHVSGVEPERVAGYATELETVDVTILAEYEDGGSLEFLVSGDCPAFRLTELGALPREVCAIEGVGRLVAEIPAEENPSEVVETFLQEYPDVSLLSKREKDGIAPRFPDSGFQRVLQNHLTDRQREVLKAAFEEGYYEWPRECTGEDIATELGITSATFSEHIQAAERKLLTVMFNGSDGGN